MTELYVQRVANLVSRLTILPRGQYSDVAPILQMLNGILIYNKMVNKQTDNT